MLDGTHAVLTPEYVEFNFVLAGLYSRFLAWLIDAVIVIALSGAIITALSMGFAAFPGFASLLSFVVWFAMDWGYSVALETAWSGQTIGKKAMGLRTIQESGVRIGFYQAAMRSLARPVDRLPLLYLVGGIAALFSSSQQRLGDMLAGTIVIRERRLKIPASLARPEGETQLLSDQTFLTRVARLSADEREVFFNAAMRREELGMEARLTLFSALSTRLQEEHGFEKPAHLSDEKLVLLVVAALLRREEAAQAAARR
jgi:uncharacterized RDD family membrane protein YckC